MLKSIKLRAPKVKTPKLIMVWESFLVSKHAFSRILDTTCGQEQKFALASYAATRYTKPAKPFGRSFR